MTVRLTEEQRAFAAEHHNLIYKYLNQRNLPEDEFYDVAVFGYLRAVRAYSNRAELWKWDFSTIAYPRMGTEIRKYFDALNIPKRSAKTVSFDYGTDDVTFSNFVTDRRYDPESEALAREFFGNFKPRERQMLKMRAYGYKNYEIAQRFKLSFREVSDELNRLRQAALELTAA